MYCETLSLTCLKNQWASSGKRKTMMAMQSETEPASRHQNMSSTLPVAMPVPPTAIVTALSREMPSLLTMG